MPGAKGDCIVPEYTGAARVVHIQFFSALISKISRIIGYTRQIFLYMEKEGVIHADFVENQAVFLKNCISQLVFLLYVQRCSKTVPEKQILGRFQGNENIG